MQGANLIEDLYVAELRDLYNAETQLVKASTQDGKSLIQCRVAAGIPENTCGKNLGTRLATGTDFRHAKGKSDRQEMSWNGRPGQRRRRDDERRL